MLKRNTAIDEYSRKRVLKIVREKSTYETGNFLLEPEQAMGFTIKAYKQTMDMNVSMTLNKRTKQEDFR